MFYLINPAYSGDKYGKTGQGGKNSTHRFKTVPTVFYLIDFAFFLQKNSDRKGRYCDYRFHFLGRPPHLRLVGLSTLSMLSARFFDAPRECKKLTTSCFVGAVDLSSGSYVDQNSRFAIKAN
ncbi:TPA: hypothetical protein PJG53_003587 [Escherichia coli]|nr:hypothetical protein [Escherichia coli]EKP6441189.1 hypothetical protein [Escherichia coli]EKT7305391.1 hypothetical protein [Escherichia coli]ELF2503010.1 hypothetical protein [Escherichia coli]HBQ4764009.1 hypothetical protein [Escherichia coli]